MAEEQKPGSPNLADQGPAATSLDNVSVDELLEDLDPEFKAQLGNLSTGLSSIQGLPSLESIVLSAEFLKEGGKIEDLESSPAPTAEETKTVQINAFKHSSTGYIFGALLKQSALTIVGLSAKTFQLILSLRSESPKDVLQNARAKYEPLLQKWLLTFQGLIQHLKTFNAKTYIRLAVIVALLVVIRFLVKDMALHLIPDGSLDPFLKSWSKVADSAGDIPIDDDAEELLNPAKHPEYTVLVQRIIANLKSPGPRHSPMVSTELYFEASNQDCAIEIHERELEVRDLLERVFEETTFEDLDTFPGKQRLKAKVRMGLNKFLTKGHVKRVFFSALNITK